ncbi:AEC family transporter [Fusobacterium sp. PH5-44]|uniref:AEC family transporter n=1 Tax=unclassified Fusobacterium TaxID=2648384 RepID=UPI003D240968
MNSITLSLNVVFPMVALISVGYILKLIKMIDDHALTVMNKIAFRVFISSMLFVNIYKFNLDTILKKENFKLISFVVICVVLEIIGGFIIFKKITTDPRKFPVMIQGIFRTNLILFGIAITQALYNGSAGVTSLLAAVMVPIFNIIAVIMLEVYRGGKINHSKIVKGIIKNPLVLAALLACPFVITGIRLPLAIIKPIESLSSIATPLSFIILGGTLKFDNLLNNMKYLLSVNIARLIILPIIFMILAIKIGFRNEALIGIFGVLGTPTAVSSFNMAKEMGADGDLAGEIVVTTSAVSFITTFLWIIFLKNFNLI